MTKKSPTDRFADELADRFLATGITTHLQDFTHDELERHIKQPDEPSGQSWMSLMLEVYGQAHAQEIAHLWFHLTKPPHKLGERTIDLLVSLIVMKWANTLRFAMRSMLLPGSSEHTEFWKMFHEMEEEEVESKLAASTPSDALDLLASLGLLKPKGDA